MSTSWSVSARGRTPWNGRSRAPCVRSTACRRRRVQGRCLSRSATRRLPLLSLGAWRVASKSVGRRHASRRPTPLPPNSRLKMPMTVSALPSPPAIHHSPRGARRSLPRRRRVSDLQHLWPTRPGRRRLGRKPRSGRSAPLLGGTESGIAIGPATGGMAPRSSPGR